MWWANWKLGCCFKWTSISLNKLVIVVSHDLENAKKYANRIIQIEDGNVIADYSNLPVDETNLQLNLKKSKLPIKYAFRMILKNYKTKLKKFIMTIILTSIALVFMGFMTNLAMFKESRLVANNLKDNNNYIYSVVYGNFYGDGGFSSYNLTNDNLIKIKEITDSKQNVSYDLNNGEKGLNFEWSEEGENSINDEIYQTTFSNIVEKMKQSEKYKTMFSKAVDEEKEYFKTISKEDIVKLEEIIYSFIEAEDDRIFDNIIGNKPTKENELVIHKYLADFMIKYGVKDSNDNLYYPKDYQELVDSKKELKMGENNVIISGIMNDDNRVFLKHLNNEKLSSNQNLKKLLEWLPKVLTAIDYPNKDNVKCLQKFISDNLVDKPDEKTLFDQLNKKAAGFDGSFWKGTLKWVNILLEKTWKYVNDMKEYLDKLILRDDVKIKSEVTVEKWWALEQSAFIVDGSSLPDGVNLNFEPKLEDVKTDDTVDCNIKVTATKNHEGGEIKREMGNVTVKVVDSTDNQPVTPDAPRETTSGPLNFEWGQHLVMGNSVTLADNIWLWWRAVFYSAEAQDPPLEAQDGKWTTEQVPNNGDYICYLQIDGNPNKTYKVTVDQNWNLCPVATNLSSKVSVEFENNDSCINYLYNKLPVELKGKVDISRRGSDYVIWLWKWEYLTIEPMTIANKWVWKDLTENLAFLIFTNYLRNERELQDVEFINDNPNLKLEGKELYVRVKKSSNVRYDETWVKKMGKRLLVKKETFWLQDASPKSLNNYIKYNNHERWNRNWDNDEQNKYYRTVRLSA